MENQDTQPECPVCKRVREKLTEESQANRKLWLCTNHYLKEFGANFGRPPKGWSLD